MHPAEFVVRQSNLDNEMNTISEQKKQEQVKMMNRLACSRAQRLPTIRAPADHAERERQTTTNVPIALQHLWTGLNKKIHHQGFSINCQTHNHQSFRNQKRERASDRGRIKKHASRKRGLLQRPFSFHTIMRRPLRTSGSVI